MTNRQRIELRLSKVRERLNLISGLEGDAFTTEVRGELDGLETEYGDLERRHRASIIGEGAAQAAAIGQFPDGDDLDGAEVRSLLGRVTLADYLGPAAAGAGIRGAAAELNSALEVPDAGPSGGAAIPWRMFLPAGGLEARAFTTTTANDGPEMQRPILQRLFGEGIMDTLGVRIDSVPVGRTEWPLITSGVAPGQVVEGTAVGAPVTAAFSFASLKPKRLTGSYEFSHEAAASVPGIEQALRRDLADAVRSKMSGLLVAGDAVDASSAATFANVAGFLTRLTGTDLAAAEATAADYGKLHASAVDGLHASTETEVSSVIGNETYVHSAGTYVSGSGESGSELLKRRSMSCMASTFIPDIAATKQPAILHAAGPNGGGIMRGDSVAAVWPTLEIVRDPYSKASQGVVLTWVTLWDARTVLRAGAYAQIDVQVA